MKGALLMLIYLVSGILFLISGITLLKRKNYKPGEKVSWGFLLKKIDLLSGILIIIGAYLLGSLIFSLIINIFNAKYGTLL
ncbi:MAG: hypothetical protein FJZ09_05710 [Candidatus Omnitrophica bacterium]|nr:hypothetical protein [Candidatus Omnitrophota bacterium]